MPPQPAIDGGLQHGSAITGTPALAVHDAHAAQTAPAGVSQKFEECQSRLGPGHAMQVQFFAASIVATTQAAHCRFGDSIAPVDQLLAGLDLQIGCIEIERIREHARLVGATQGGACRQSGALWRRPGLAQRLDAPHRGAKQFAFFFVVHANARGAPARPPKHYSIVRRDRRARDGEGLAA